MFLPLYVGLCVSRVTQKLSANFGEIIWRGGMHDWEQVIRFWWFYGSWQRSTNFKEEFHRYRIEAVVQICPRTLRCEIIFEG